jgi:RNA polymerase sigma factor (sigma-70 family)
MAGTDSRREHHDAESLRLVQDNAAELLRFARRFSLCADDAHDAYQRAIEILVRRMRTEPPAEPLSWLRTVLRNEALTLRAQRERFVSREPLDLDRHHDRDAEDPSERIAGFERLGRVAEALQRLKPQEVTALVLRAEGLTYREICTRTGWTYTKTNRAITEGRRALVTRLGTIESGAECDRWLPRLSTLADGEASAREVAELRPHLRACSACRATLRELHETPSQVAALVPVALVPLAADPGVTAGHVETLMHALLERTMLAATRLQAALDAVPGTKIAAVAASTAALASGGAAIEHATHAPPRARPAVEAAAASAASSAPLIAISQPLALPKAAPARPARVAGKTSGPSGGGGEFSFEEPSGTAAPAKAPPVPPTAHAAFARPAPSPPHDAANAEFAGP